jgi:hypothetical protein
VKHIRFYILSLTLLFLGCATTPPRPNPNVAERAIVQSILGELCRAVINIQGLSARGNSAAINEHFSANEGWLALIETSLRTDIEGTVSPSATLLGPIIPGLLVPKGGTAGSYNASAGAFFDQIATTLRDGQRYVVLDTLLKSPDVCPQSGTNEYLAYLDFDQASCQTASLFRQ